MHLIPLQSKDYMLEIKYIVKELNEKYKYSQADISRILNVPERTFSAWLTGRVSCRHTKMLVLAMRQVRVLLNEAFN
jgi:DNA-binding transcriptional regulator YiaG